MATFSFVSTVRIVSRRCHLANVIAAASSRNDFNIHRLKAATHDPWSTVPYVNEASKPIPFPTVFLPKSDDLQVRCEIVYWSKLFIVITNIQILLAYLSSAGGRPIAIDVSCLFVRPIRSFMRRVCWLVRSFVNVCWARAEYLEYGWNRGSVPMDHQ